MLTKCNIINYKMIKTLRWKHPFEKPSLTTVAQNEMLPLGQQMLPPMNINVNPFKLDVVHLQMPPEDMLHWQKLKEAQQVSDSVIHPPLNNRRKKNHW